MRRGGYCQRQPHVSARAVISNRLPTLNRTRPVASGRPSGNMRKTLEFLVFPACAHFGRGIRLTEKDTINQNPSKSIGKQSKISYLACPEKIRLNAGPMCATWDLQDSLGEPLKTLRKMKVPSSASMYSLLFGGRPRIRLTKRIRLNGILQKALENKAKSAIWRV